MAENKVGPNKSDISVCKLEGVKDDEARKATETKDDRKWIQENIKIKNCPCFSEGEEKNTCKCGLSKSKHTSNVDNQQNETGTVPTNAFGEIEFTTNGRTGRTAKFVRVDSQTDMSTMLKLMIDIWKMEKPKLLISVAGNKNVFDMKAGLKDRCRSGLMKAVQGTGVWIITGGIHEGVMKYVGKVMEELRTISTDNNHIITIGIAPWGIIQNKHHLINEEGSYPAGYSMEKQQKSKKYLLDPNHSHFILVDDSTQNMSASATKFRNKLESKISGLKMGIGKASQTNDVQSARARQKSAAPPINETALVLVTSDNIQQGAALAENRKADKTKINDALLTSQEPVSSEANGNAGQTNTIDALRSRGTRVSSPVDRKEVKISTIDTPANRQENSAPETNGKAPQTKNIQSARTRQKSAAPPIDGKAVQIISDNIQRSATPAANRKAVQMNIRETDCTRQKSAAPAVDGKEEMSVPAVLLVLQLNPDTLETMKTALDNDIPAVIVKDLSTGSNQSEILTQAFPAAEKGVTKNKLGLSDKSDKQKTDTLKKKLKTLMMSKKFCKEQNMDINIKLIIDCKTKSHLIYVYTWNSGNFDIDAAILNALVKANMNNQSNKTKDTMYQLKLALAWNRIDIAKNEIVLDDIRKLTGSLDDVMFSAILLDRVDFLELLLDNGVILKRFATMQRLQELYKNIPSGGFLESLLSKMRQKKSKKFSAELKLDDVGQLIMNLLGDSNFQFTRYSVSERNKNMNATAGVNKQDTPIDDNPCLDLFIWSVLNNRQNMAKFFWRRGKDAIAAALFADALFFSISLLKNDRELQAQLDKNRGEFNSLATGVLNECHSASEQKAHNLLIRNLPPWGKASCIQIALKANNKHFVSQTACQDLFNDIWMGDMNQKNGTLKLLLCVVIPPLIPRLIIFKEKEDGERVHADETTEKTDENLIKSQPSDNKNESLQSHQAQTKVHVKEHSFCQKIVSFYRAPVVIFLHHVISYLIFLSLYSYVLISRFDEKISVEERVLIVWVSSILIQEIKQVYTTPSTTVERKIKSYITDGWNILDIVTILFFAVGMILRAIDCEQTLEAARVFLGVSLIAFFLRLLFIFSASTILGPKLVMIIQMVFDVAYVLVILLVFIVGYAISSYAILYPNAELSLDTTIAIFSRPYWNMYGELKLEEIEGSVDCTNDPELYKTGTYSRCPTVSGKYFVPILMGFYMLMCNILLLNLLIALFSSTIQKVQENSYIIWCFQQYSLINEYNKRFFLAHPLSLFVHVIQLILWIWRKCHRKCSSKAVRAPGRNVFLKMLGPKPEHELRKFEDVMAKKFQQNGEQSDSDCVTNRLDQKSITGIETALTKLEKRMQNLEKQLKWIVKSLTKNNDGANK